MFPFFSLALFSFVPCMLTLGVSAAMRLIGSRGTQRALCLFTVWFHTVCFIQGSRGLMNEGPLLISMPCYHALCVENNGPGCCILEQIRCSSFTPRKRPSLIWAFPRRRCSCFLGGEPWQILAEGYPADGYGQSGNSRVSGAEVPNRRRKPLGCLNDRKMIENERKQMRQ